MSTTWTHRLQGPAELAIHREGETLTKIGVARDGGMFRHIPPVSVEVRLGPLVSATGEIVHRTLVVYDAVWSSLRDVQTRPDSHLFVSLSHPVVVTLEYEPAMVPTSESEPEPADDAVNEDTSDYDSYYSEHDTCPHCGEWLP